MNHPYLDWMEGLRFYYLYRLSAVEFLRDLKSGGISITMHAYTIKSKKFSILHPCTYISISLSYTTEQQCPFPLYKTTTDKPALYS